MRLEVCGIIIIKMISKYFASALVAVGSVSAQSGPGVGTTFSIDDVVAEQAKDVYFNQILNLVR